MVHMQDGEHNENSDIDIMILVDMDDMQIKERLDDISSLSFDFNMDYNVLLSPLVEDINKFNYWISAVPFYQNVIREGVVLNG